MPFGGLIQACAGTVCCNYNSIPYELLTSLILLFSAHRIYEKYWYSGHIITSAKEVPPCVCTGAQPRLKSRGDQGLGPNTGALAKGPAGCWEREGVACCCCDCEGLGVSPPKFFLKTQMLNPAFWLLLCLVLKTTAKKLGETIHYWSPNLKVGDQSPPVPTVDAPVRLYVCLSFSNCIRTDLTDFYDHFRT